MSELNQIAEAHSKYLTDPSDRNLPEGFQVTEAGLIPECWEYKLIGEIASVFSGGTPNRKIAEYWDGDIPWVTTTLIDGAAINAANEYITRKGVESSSAKWCKAGTILMAMYGQGKTRGKVGVLGIDATINQACAAIELKDSSSTTFVLQVLNSMYEDIRDLSNSGGQENLSSGIIKNIGIPYPPAEERSAIANALSDVDALINSLEKLIAKKQAIKTATMQQLLTGKTRLPQFATHPDGTPKGYKQSELGEIPEDWEVVSLGAISTFANGKPYEPYINEAGPFKLITLDSVSIAGDLKQNHKAIGFFDESLQTGDLVCVLSDIAHAKLLGLCGLIDKDNTYVLNQRMGRIRLVDGYDSAFMRFLINRHQDHFRLRGQGSSQRHIYKKDIDELKVSCPRKPEQLAIAQIISDMESELNSLNVRMIKARQLKQGMMQELLTGKTRLVKPAGSAA